MEFMNDFLEREAASMKEFLKNISVSILNSPSDAKSTPKTI